MLTASAPVRWHPATRIAFRFCVVYFGLYSLTTGMLRSLIGQLPHGTPLLVGDVTNRLVAWTGGLVFHVVAQPVWSGSGDRMFDWVQAFCLLVIAVAVTAIWSVVDSHRRHYERLNRWFRVFARLLLASTLVSYGILKVIPVQMPATSLGTLLEPFGNFSPMGVLWSAIGASTPFERLLGCAELTGAILLFVPRTAMLGAVICLMNCVAIFALNMSYDVPAKLFSFHLILLSAFLLAPDARRLLSQVLAKRSGTAWTTVAQAAFGAYLVGMNVYATEQIWRGPLGTGGPRPPLYGLWQIGELTIDGGPPAVGIGYDEWRRLVIESPAAIVVWRLDDTTQIYAAQTDMTRNVVTLSRPGEGVWTASLSFDRPRHDRLIFDGTIDGHAIHMVTGLVDPKQFPLVSRGFHWIQESAFNQR